MPRPARSMRARLARLVLAALLLTCVASIVFAQTPPSVPQRELTVLTLEGLVIPAAGGRVALHLSRRPDTTDGQFSIIVVPLSNRLQKRDLSSQAIVTGENLEIDFSFWPLPPEMYEIRVYRTALDGRITLIGVSRMLVLEESAAPPPGFIDPSLRPPLALHLDMGVTSQVSEQVGGGQRPATRSHFTDLGVQGSVEANASGQDWETRAQVQLIGSSFRQNAPTFGRFGENAAKLDVASYLVDAAWRDSRVNIGHIAVDVNPLLLTGINNRGIAFVQKLPGGIDLGVTAQNGESIAGYRNLLGLAERDNQYRSLGLGYDIYPERPGFFRVDVNAVDARVINQTFGAPLTALMPPDESRGSGGRLAWRNELGTLRMETVFATSHFRPGVVPLNFPSELSGTARTFEGGYDVVKDKIVGTVPLTLTLGARHEHASPFYRSIGSGYQSNYDMNLESLALRVGSALSQIMLTQRYDNVGADRVFIRNRVQGSAFSLTLPLANFLVDDLKLVKAVPPSASVAAFAPGPPPGAAFAGASPGVNPGATPGATAAANPASRAPGAAPALTPTPSAMMGPASSLPWAPAITFSQQYTHGFGDHDFVPAGYGIEDLPDVYIVSRTIGLQWQFERVSFGARAIRITQTNRQPGYTQLSTWDRRYSLNLDWRATDTLMLSLAYDPTYNFRFDTNARTDARQLRGSVNWTPNDTWQFTAEINQSVDFDSLDTRYNRQNISQVQATRRFTVPIPGHKSLPAQAYLRVADTRGYNFNAGSPVLEPSVRRVQLGFNVSLF